MGGVMKRFYTYKSNRLIKYCTNLNSCLINHWERVNP